jgi:hypothetical protein
MQSEGVFITIVSTVVATSIAIVAVAVRAFGSPLLGLLVANVEVVIFDGRPRARATIVSFDGVVRCKSSGRDTPSATERAVLLTGSLNSHRITSAIDGFLATSFNSKLFGGTMAAARVQSMAWRG